MTVEYDHEPVYKMFEVECRCGAWLFSYPHDAYEYTFSDDILEAYLDHLGDVNNPHDDD